MKIIVTGATGFVGQNLIKYLKPSLIEIEPLSLRTKDWQNQINQQADAIIHLAGKAHDTSNTSDFEEYFKVNSDLTAKLYENFLKSDIKDFFFFSSVKAIADKVDNVLTENILGNPETPYGKSKLAAEQYLLAQYLPEGKRLFIIRPCMIHGPGNKGNLNLLYKLVERGIPWPLASFENQRSFLSVDNLCYLLKLMIENKELTSGMYNFADDKALSTNELVVLIAKTLGKRPKLWKISKGLITAITKVGDKIKFPLNSERLKKLTENYIVSNDKIKKALDNPKLPLTAEEGLIKTIKSFNNNQE
jgi:nucleoside-diphosphate-sugar epimerase